MIDQMIITNFQSHKRTIITFEEGLNVLVGSSDQGKSAILRALLWAVNNKPAGTDDIISHWIRDGKGKINLDAVTAVKVFTDRGAVKRLRTQSDNEYLLWHEQGQGIVPKVFRAFGQSVPSDISNFFQLTDVNIQQQHDAPFLLSLSPADVARYFNKIVRLDVIDKVLGNAESLRKDSNKSIKLLEAQKEELKAEEQSFGWIDKAEVVCKKLNKAENNLFAATADAKMNMGFIEQYQEAKMIIKSLPDIKNGNRLLREIDKIKPDYEGLNELGALIDQYKELRRSLKDAEIILPALDKCEVIEQLNASIRVSVSDSKLLQDEVNGYQVSRVEVKKFIQFDKDHANALIKDINAIRPNYAELSLLKSQLDSYEEEKEVRNSCQESTNELRLKLPNTCPTCGQSL